tara:strand:+ start:1566 stop:3209 length:1644 start_codon:yes stop_codon:yes gene_type:complete
MVNSNKLKDSLFIVLFFISTLYTFSLGNLYYLTTKGPDYNFYKPYFDYFLTNQNTTGIEQGLLYYFINSLLIYSNSEIVSSVNAAEYFSNSIQLGNFIFYLIGLLGLGIFLKDKKFKTRNIFFALTMVNFFPPAFEFRLMFKPEVLIFSCLIWAIVFLEKYLKERNILYLLFTVPPLAVIFTTKANLALMVFLYLMFIYLNKIFNINKSNFYKSVGVFLIFFIGLSYENYQANELLIFQHQSPEEFLGSAELSYLYNLDINSLISNPFRDSQRDSYIGVLLLDTFDDYFGNFWTDDSSVFFHDRTQIIDNRLIPFTGIFLTLIFYFAVFLKIINKDKYRKFYVMPFYGILVQMGLSQFIQYDPSNGDVAKTYYYSFFLIIVFLILISEIMKKYFNLSVVSGLIFILIFIHILGFPKEENNERAYLLEFNNESNILCDLNDFIFTNIDSQCSTKEYLFCEYNFATIEKVIIRNSEFNFEKFDSENIPIELSKNGEIIKAKNYTACLEFVNKGYSVPKKYTLTNIPYLNFLNFLIFIFSIFYYLKIRKV